MKLSYVKALAERALKTFAQSLVAALGSGAAGLVSMPWSVALQLAAAATVLSVLTSVASAGFGNDGPSLSGETLEDK